jgi:hypothetical protein
LRLVEVDRFPVAMLEREEAIAEGLQQRMRG